jgi:hypothetical protein
MKQLITLLILLLLHSSQAIALPEEVRYDMLKTKLAEQLKAKQYGESLSTIKELRALDRPLSKSLAYFEGKALFETGKKAHAYKILEQYVTNHGKEAKYYSQAISYLVKAEPAYKKEQQRIADEAKKRKQAEKERKKAEVARKQRLAAEKKAAAEKREAEEEKRKKLAEAFSNRDRIYHDDKTGLTWLVPTEYKYVDSVTPENSGLVARHQAEAFCHGVKELGGNWRLATLQEVATRSEDVDRYLDKKTFMVYSKNKIFANSYLWVKGHSDFSIGHDSTANTIVLSAAADPSSSYSWWHLKFHSGQDKHPPLCVYESNPERYAEFMNNEFTTLRQNGHSFMLTDSYQDKFLQKTDMSIGEARNRCKKIRTGGFDDWRIPSRKDIEQKLGINFHPPSSGMKFPPHDSWWCWHDGGSDGNTFFGGGSSGDFGHFYLMKPGEYGRPDSPGKISKRSRDSEWCQSICIRDIKE